MTQTVTIDEASRQLNQLLARLTSSGDEIIIARDGTPVARLTPISVPPTRRVPGCDAGKFAVSTAFFEPLPDDVVDEFYR